MLYLLEQGGGGCLLFKRMPFVSFMNLWSLNRQNLLRAKVDNWNSWIFEPWHHMPQSELFDPDNQYYRGLNLPVQIPTNLPSEQTQSLPSSVGCFLSFKSNSLKTFWKMHIPPHPHSHPRLSFWCRRWTRDSMLLRPVIAPATGEKCWGCRG